MSVTGKVYLVGAGPGDPELVTIKAQRLIRECDALVYDYLSAPELLGWTKPSCEHHYVGKRAGFHALPQEEIEKLLVHLARAGKNVVRLKGGDPFIFGRGGEEALTLKEAGILYEVVPAVTAALGCAAYTGVPLTHRDYASSVTFLSGHERPDKDEPMVDWAAHAATDATLVLYMAMGRLPLIAATLVDGGRPADTPVMVVQWGTTAKQRSVSGQLSNIAERVYEAGIGAPAVVIVGAVAALGDSLAWFDPSI
ncbi:MAG: uroporphyrinogen-III C-methyltransferase [Verrucomicrobiota bacterium JB022]|nr:uroporphyrinogen-III C-methyltransferase [Verrucomicrobiota bacterium JB022]